MEKLSQIHTFTKVIESKSFAKAAKELKLTTAAVSKQISTLEKQLGVELLIRDTRNVSLSPIGKEYYKHCQSIMNEVEKASQLIKETKSEPSGQLKVTSGTFFKEKYLVPKLKGFTSKYPKINLSLEINERMPDLKAEDVDIIVGMSVEGHEEYVRRKIGATRYVLCASTEYLQQAPPLQTPHDLKHHFYMTHTIREPDHIITLKDGTEVILEPVIRVNDSRTLLDLVEQGLGCALILEYVASQAIKDKRVKSVLKEHFVATRPIYVFYRRSRYVSKKIQAFLDYFIDDSH